MTVPSDIPGLVQSYRFSDAAQYYNGSNRFYDQSDYADWDNNDMVLLAGTPTFADIGAGSKRALVVDNTSHWDFIPGHAWEGTIMLVAKPNYVSGATITKYITLSGTAGTLTSNANLHLQHASSDRRFGFAGTGASVSLQLGQTNNNIRAVMFSASQENRRFYGSQGSAPSSTAAYTTTTNSGFQLSPSCSSAPDTSSRRMIFGALAGLAAGTTAVTDMWLYAFEMHIWKDPVLLTHQADCLQLIADKLVEFA